jgi:hypothetical protein
VVYSVLAEMRKGTLSRAGARMRYGPDHGECDGQATPYNTAPAVPWSAEFTPSASAKISHETQPFTE